MFFKRKKKEENSKSEDSKSEDFNFGDNPVVDNQENTKSLQLIKLVVVGCLVLSFSNYSTLQDMSTNSKTVLQYGFSGSEMWVSGDDTSTEYARHMAVFFVTLWGNVTSASAGSQYAEILKYAHPFYLSSIKKRLLTRQKVLEKFKTMALYSRFTPKDKLTKSQLTDHKYTNINSPVYRVTFTMHQTRIIGSEPGKEKPVHVVFEYTVENSLARLLDIYETNKGGLEV